jgi:hypothetical protein
LTFFSLSARSALKSKSSGDSSFLAGIVTGAREGDGGDGETEEVESEASSGLGGPARVLAGTDLDRRNFGFGRAEAAGEAWKVGPA